MNRATWAMQVFEGWHTGPRQAGFWSMMTKAERRIVTMDDVTSR